MIDALIWREKESKYICKNTSKQRPSVLNFFIYTLFENFVMSLAMKEFWKSINVSQSYQRE